MEEVLDRILDVFEVWGLFIVLGVYLLALLFQVLVKSRFSRYSKILNSVGMTGADAAAAVLRLHGVTGVGIQRVSGDLTDHYDPKNGVINLSEKVYDTASVAAVGIAAHEAGHAVQHAEEYFPIRVRTAIIPITNIGSRLSTPLLIAGLIFSLYPLALAGVILFGTCVVFQLVTLPVEFNASRRAMAALKEAASFSDADLSGARKMLSAAAMTYVAALAVALTQFLRLLAIVTSGRRRD